MNRRLLGYLIVNAIVSAVVIIAILFAYDRFFRPATPAPPPDSSTPSTVEIAAIAGVGQAESETVTLRNNGQAKVIMGGWMLKEASGAEYIFPDLALLPGGSVDLHTAPGDDTATDLYWGLPEPAWSSGEFATLTDADGAVQAIYRIP
jgi:hypothetical protein